jgi:cysteine desulfurase/selenocysteine lyase
VRAGHVCAQPLVAALGARAVVRASAGVYSAERDATLLAAALADARRFFQ